MVLFDSQKYIRTYDIKLEIISAKYNEISNTYTFNIKWIKGGGRYFYNLTFSNFHTNEKLVKAIEDNKYIIYGNISYDKRNGEILKIKTKIKKTFFKKNYKPLKVIELKKKQYRKFDKKGILT
jgi:hypothetical protein